MYPPGGRSSDANAVGGRGGGGEGKGESRQVAGLGEPFCTDEEKQNH